MPAIPALDPATATGRTKELFDAVQKKLGGVPNLLRTLGQAPAALDAYLRFSEATATGTFDAKTREAIALTVAGANHCDYCASAHTAISKGLKVEPEEIARRLHGQSSDPRTQAILKFAREIVDRRGLVSDEALAAARRAGLTDGDLVETVAVTALNLFTNYVNHVARTQIDFPVISTEQVKAA